jgi:hypothetical protein
MTLTLTLTTISIGVAVLMMLIALRVVIQERRRSAARVAALQADIYHTADEDLIVLHDPPSTFQSSSPAFDTATHPQAIPIAPLIAVGAAIIVGMLVGAARYRASATEEQSPANSVPVATKALELVALNHQQAGDHLTVSGVVRNPQAGNELDHLTAVVLLFNSQGSFMTSARSTVDAQALRPGTEATFVVDVPGAADVGKYRVSFRTDERVVPHVDRR